MREQKRVIIGMSGGVDSSVAALLLQQQGYLVEGLFMKNWEDDDTDTYCAASDDIKYAESVCNQLNIPLHTVNFSQDYWDRVFEHFLLEYREGRTPNPDILCNQEIKFKAFLNYALSLGADFIATGHYAGKDFHETLGFQLKKAIDPNKDQSYFLYRLSQQALAKSLFPLASFPKEQVRQLAKEMGFTNSEKKDSTGICFIGERKFKTFLNRYLPAKPGDMETPERIKIGTHDGLMFYTIGQRQGLGIGGQPNSDPTPWYVVEKDIPRNTLIVAQGVDHPLLYKTELTAINCHWITSIPSANSNEFECAAKVRYRQTEQPCRVKINPNGSCTVLFLNPQRAITPGQSVVFYQESICLGGGIIQ